MSRKTYAIGDHVVLRAGLSRATTGERACRIVGVLPADHGEVQYRVRLEGENFERRIVQSDIEADDTTASAPRTNGKREAPRAGSPWLKPLTIRTAR